VTKGFERFKSLADTVIIDSAPGLGKEVIQAARSADRVIVVATPDITSLTGAYKSVQLCKMLGKEVSGIVLNRVGRSKRELSDAAVQSMMDGLPILGKIPEDKFLASSAMRAMPVLQAYPHAPSSRAFKRLACTLTGQAYVENPFAEEIYNLFGIK
jgi:MinD-like ATPase involved in chromosome partitioning or flagellar assembly